VNVDLSVIGKLFTIRLISDGNYISKTRLS